MPEGYEAWKVKAEKTIAEHPEVFNTPEGGVDHEEGKHVKDVKGGRVFVTSKVERKVDDTTEEWDGEVNEGPELEGTRSASDRRGQAVIGMKRPGSDEKSVVWETEPKLTVEQ